MTKSFSEQMCKFVIAVNLNNIIWINFGFIWSPDIDKITICHLLNYLTPFTLNLFYIISTAHLLKIGVVELTKIVVENDSWILVEHFLKFFVQTIYQLLDFETFLNTLTQTNTSLISFDIHLLLQASRQLLNVANTCKLLFLHSNIKLFNYHEY